MAEILGVSLVYNWTAIVVLYYKPINILSYYFEYNFVFQIIKITNMGHH